MFRRTLISALAALAAATLAAAPAVAQRGEREQDGDRRDRWQQNGFPGSQWNNPQQERAPQREVPLNSVLRSLKAQYGGEHLDARKDGNRYIISWITENGRRLTIEVDATNGRVLSTR